MTEYYFYRCTVEPTDGHSYFDHSAGIVGYRTPQARRKYITFATVKELEKELAESYAQSGTRTYKKKRVFS